MSTKHNEIIDISNKTEPNNSWFLIKTLCELQAQTPCKLRIKGKQIAFFSTPSGIRACDNRCPHEGYPLSQGSLSDSCTLTCNWHNWKFNLDNGENFYGGDKLRIYPVEIRDGNVWIDLIEPSFEQRYATIINNLKDAFDENDYGRIGREIARLMKIEADPLDALRLCIEWSWEKMKFGWTHAYAGMADWLQLYHETDDPELKLVCLMESVGHTADDVLREKAYPYTEDTEEFSQSDFLLAIEQENENRAISMVLGGLKAGLGFEDFELAFTKAALAHYNDFGHSLIYVSKVGELIDHLGERVVAPLLCSLVREIIFATREDKIPEFRGYSDAIANWGKSKGVKPQAKNWHKKGIDSALNATVACSDAQPTEIYNALLLASAVSMLSYDIDQQHKVHVPVSGNVGWLSFTHQLTFANAVRKQCARFPENWPSGLLQMACFIGRNAAYTNKDYDVEAWALNEPTKDLHEIIQGLFNHDQDEYIVSVHLLKTSLAVREEIKTQNIESIKVICAALNRFLNSPLKRKQAHRTAYQSLSFVSKE